MKYNEIKHQFHLLSHHILPTLHSIKDIITKYFDLQKKHVSQKVALSTERNKLQSLQQDFDNNVAALNDLEELQDSIQFMIQSLFSKKAKINLDNKLEIIAILIKRLDKQIDNQTELIKELESAIIASSTQISETYELITEEIGKIKENAKSLGRAYSIFKNATILNWDKILGAAIAKKNEAEIYLSKQESILGDYVSPDEKDIAKRMNALYEEIDRLADASTMRRLEKVKVIAATMDCYIARFAFQPQDNHKLSLDVHHIFLDEAAYCNLVKGITLFANPCPVTFLGDHKQLPPVCEMNDIDMQSGLSKSVFLWSQSTIYAENLFAKDFDDAYNDYIQKEPPNFILTDTCNLTKTYRFGNVLANVLDRYVYRNGFDSARNDLFDFTIINVRAKTGEKKRENPAEALAIKEYLNANNIHDFAVLSPYKNQVSYIGKIMPSLRKDQRVMTVHKSQGQEWEVVILSVSDTHNMYFTDTLRANTNGLLLLNTAISRAKKRIVLVCDCRYWQHKQGQLICGLIEASNA